MKKLYSFNIGAIICVMASGTVLYYFLMRENLHPFSIRCLFTHFENGGCCWQVIGAGLLPIYLAIMIFGVGILGIRLGSALQKWLTQHWRRK